MDPSQAVKALEDAADREQIFGLLLRAARSKTRFAALLSVHTDHVRGRRAIADDGFDCGSIGNLRIPRNKVPAFESAVTSGTPYVGAIATGDKATDALLKQLGGKLPKAAVVLPLTVGTRTIALVVGHRGDKPLPEADVADLLPLVSAMSPVLARILAGRAEATSQKPAMRVGTAPPVPAAEPEPAPDDVGAQRRRLAAHRKNQAWEELAEGIRALIRIGIETGDPDEDEQLGLLFELGTVEAEHLFRPELAIEAWRGAQTIDAGDARVQEALERLYVQQARWEDCVDLLEKRAALTEAVRDRVEFLLDVAEMSRERLDDDDRAVGAYERILQWDPGHEQAGKELEDLYFARKQWEPLAGLLLDRASRKKDDKAGIAALESVAQMYEDRVGDPRAAVLVWLAVLRRDPKRTDVLEQLERLGGPASAWEEILPECEALAEKLEKNEPEAAARMWRQIGRWKRDHVGNRDEAMRALERAARFKADDPEAMSELLEILRVDGPWFELATVLTRRAEIEPVRRDQAELYAELADVYESRLGQPVEAVTYYEKALAGEPSSKAVLIALRRLHRQGEAWDALGKVLARLIESLGENADRSEVVDLQVELGTLYAEKLGRSEDAVHRFRAAQALDPKNLPAFHGLEQVYQTTGQTEALLETTEAEIDAAGPDQAHRYADVATAWDELVGKFDRAAACWRKLLARDPAHLPAHQALARALRKASDWDALVTAYRAQLKVVATPAERATLLLELADVLETRKADVDGAIAACQEALKVDARYAPALDALGRLYERAGRWKPALDVLERMLSAATDARRRADLLQRIGQVHVSGHDPVKARVSLEQAIALDPSNAAAHEGMARLHLEHGELAKAGEMLLRAAQLAQSQFDAIRCLNDAAWLYRDRLADTDTARDCLRRVLELEPEHVDAKRALAELLHGAGQWETLWPHLEQLVQRAKEDPSTPAAERHQVFTQAARCAVELGNFGKALELYDLACSLDPTHVQTLLERGDALFRKKAWAEAIEAYQAVLARHGQTLDSTQTVGALRRLAQVHKESGRIPQAQAFHQKVLDIDPAHQDTLRDLAEMHLGRARWDEAIASMRALADAVPEAQRPGVLERIGDLYREKLANPGRAASTYLTALDVDAGNRRVLQKLLDLQSETGQWKAALETIDRFLDLEADPARRGTYLLASATIRRMKLKDEPGALEFYEKALDSFFARDALDEATRARALEAFEAIDELITAQKDWKRQEQAYRRMIKRLPRTDPVLMSLWHALGEIYRTRLKHFESAIEAFEVAHSLDQGKSPERGRILAELYGLSGSRRVPADKVTEGAAKLVEVDPTNAEAYRALGKACLEAGKLDEAWCVCRALIQLKRANSEEESFYKRHRAHETRKATGIIDEESWSFVRSTDEDRVISAIFAQVWEGPVSSRSGTAKSFELKAKDKMQVDGGTRVIGKIFRHAARVLNAPLPDVYVQPNRPGRLLLASVVEKNRLSPAVIVARDLMAGFRDTEIAASVGGMIALLRPAYYLRLALPTVDELEAALIAAARLGGRAVGRKDLEPMVNGFGVEIQKRLTPPVGDVLRGLAARLPERPDLSAWRNAVDVSARRAGLLVCGELAAATRMASTEGLVAGGPSPSAKVSDLIAYSVSPSYFAARRHLGVMVA